MLYFVVALLDKWIDLVSGGQNVGLSAALNVSTRISVGFGLAYYLIGAVLLDYKAQHLHQLSEKVNPISIKSREYLRDAALNDAKAKRRLYMSTLAKFLSIHVWTLAVASAVVLVLDGSQRAFIMLLSYVGAYTGLLLYQVRFSTFFIEQISDVNSIIKSSLVHTLSAHYSQPSSSAFRLVCY